MAFSISALSVSSIRGYREFAFSAALAESNHDPYFSIETAEEWMAEEGYLLYKEWISNGGDPKMLVDANEVGFLDYVALSQLKEFRKMLTAFFPGNLSAKLKAIILDGEVAQAQGLADFLVMYVAMNNVEVPGGLRDGYSLLKLVLKLCSVHFERNIDKLPATISKATVKTLKRFVGLNTQEEIEKWHTFCRGLDDISCSNWYQHKLTHPWFLPALNPFLSGIAREDWDRTPNHTNLGEGAHAGQNAETSTGLPILEAILRARDRDNKHADELEAIELNAIMPKRWNGTSEREHNAAQRQKFALKVVQTRDLGIRQLEQLEAERAECQMNCQNSLALKREIDSRVKALRQQKSTAASKGAIQLEISNLQDTLRQEGKLRKTYRARVKEINDSINSLKEGGLSGARINGRRSGSAQREPESDVASPAEVTPVENGGELDNITEPNELENDCDAGSGPTSGLFLPQDNEDYALAPTSGLLLPGNEDSEDNGPVPTSARGLFLPPGNEDNGPVAVPGLFFNPNGPEMGHEFNFNFDVDFDFNDMVFPDNLFDEIAQFEQTNWVTPFQHPFNEIRQEGLQPPSIEENPCPNLAGAPLDNNLAATSTQSDSIEKAGTPPITEAVEVSKKVIKQRKRKAVQADGDVTEENILRSGEKRVRIQRNFFHK